MCVSMYIYIYIYVYIYICGLPRQNQAKVGK